MGQLNNQCETSTKINAYFREQRRDGMSRAGNLTPGHAMRQLTRGGQSVEVGDMFMKGESRGCKIAQVRMHRGDVVSTRGARLHGQAAQELSLRPEVGMTTARIIWSVIHVTTVCQGRTGIVPCRPARPAGIRRCRHTGPESAGPRPPPPPWSRMPCGPPATGTRGSCASRD